MSYITINQINIEYLDHLLNFAAILIGIYISVFFGNFTYSLLSNSKISDRMKHGLLLLSMAISILINYTYRNQLDIIYSLLICYFVGFIVPIFRDIKKLKKLVKIGIKGYKNAKNITDSIIDEVDKELED